jgi:purine nucleosidase
MKDGKVRVIIDTDIGGDPDDAVAIAFALASPEISIEGITTVYADVEYHARRAAKLMELAGGPRCPIYNGLNETLLRNRNTRWMPDAGAGDSAEGDALDGGPQPANAGRFLRLLFNRLGMEG